MNLGEMKTRAWWIIDDNESSPTEITAATLLLMINEGIQELSPYLNIIKSATLTFVAGVATLPTDFISPIAVYDEGVLLREIKSIKSKVGDTATTSQFYIPNNTQINIFGITPTGTVTIWYTAYETALTTDATTPSNVPVQFHYALPEIYVKAKYYFKLNQNADYADLMRQWEQIKGQVFAATHADRLANGDIIEDAYYDPLMSEGSGSSW